MKMSGNDFSNISGAFAGASSALGNAADIKARQALEEMKDQRAENLARMSFGWKAQHDVNMAERSEAHDTRVTAQRLTGEREIQQAINDRQISSQNAYMDRITAMQQAERERMEGREDAADRRQRQGQIAQNRIEMQRAKDEHLRDEAVLQQDISRAVQDRPSLAMIDDPAKKHAAMAADPAIGPMLDQLSAMQKQHADSITAYTLFGAQLGDPMFQGKQTSELDTASAAGAPQLATRPSGGGDATPNNPKVPPNQLPTYPANNPADNTPAVAAPPPGSQPGSSPAGMPPTAGPLTRPPATTMIGPLRMPPQLIPPARNSALSNSTPMPGINVPANASTGMFPAIGNPTGAPPSLIPQQGF
jgi:hypothetical protein